MNTQVKLTRIRRNSLFFDRLSSSPLRDCVVMRENPIDVMLSEAKHLAFSFTYEDEILRLSPQDDIATQSLTGED